MTDQFGPGSHILYQDITLPSGQPATLSFALYIVNRSVSFVIPTFPTLDFTVFPNQHFRVDIMDPSAPVDSVTTGVLKNVYITEPGDPLESGYTTTTASLDAFAGRQIRLRFAEVDNQGYFQVAIDKVIISGSPLASLTISPGSGSFVQTQRFDLTLILEASPGVGVTGGSATLDGGDVTGALVGCIDGHIGTLTGTRTGLTFRCPDVPASIFSVSSHTFAVRLTLSDGNAVSASVTWEIIGNQE